MKEQFIQTIQQHMLPHLNNEQMVHLQEALEYALYGLRLTESDVETPAGQINALESFIAAKRIEGCSEKTLKRHYLHNHVQV